MSEQFPSSEQELPYARGLTALEHRMMSSSKPMAYDEENLLFYEAPSENAVDVICRTIEVDVEDQYDPGLPIMYQAALFTARGVGRTGIRAQLLRIVKDTSSIKTRVLGYRFNSDGTVEQSEMLVNPTGNSIVRNPEVLDSEEVEGLNDQLETLNLSNDERTFRTILK